MALYCGTFDVVLFSQVAYTQFGAVFPDEPTYTDWIGGTLIPKAMDMVDNYVGHNFQLNNGSIRLDGSGKEGLHITRIGLVDVGAGWVVPRLMPVPMMTVTAVTIDSVAKTATDFQRYDEIVTYENNCFASGRQNVDLVGTWGYLEVPHDIQYVTAQVCAHALTEMIRLRMLPDIITPILEGGGSDYAILSSPKVLTKNEKEILDRYRFREYGVGKY